MEINKLKTPQAVNNNSKPKFQRIKETGLKEDTFNKAVETVTPEEAEAFLLDIKIAYGTSKFIIKRSSGRCASGINGSRTRKMRSCCGTIS